MEGFFAGIVPENWGVFANALLEATLLVKLTILLLFVMSLWVWAVIIDRSFHLASVRSRMNLFLKRYRSGIRLQRLWEQSSLLPKQPCLEVFVAYMEEFDQSRKQGVDGDRTNERAQKLAGNVLRRVVNDMESSIGALATIGSVAPFIGLFGTVLGIMHAFSSIAQSGDTSLVVVAPAIAEALFVTGLGLFVAIPAVMAYNGFLRKIENIGVQAQIFSEELSVLVDRRINFQQEEAT